MRQARARGREASVSRPFSRQTSGRRARELCGIARVARKLSRSFLLVFFLRFMFVWFFFSPPAVLGAVSSGGFGNAGDRVIYARLAVGPECGLFCSVEYFC